MPNEKIELHKMALENLEEMTEAGIVEEVADDSDKIAKADFAVCVRKTSESLANVPDIWINQIDFDTCVMCGSDVFFRNNIPENVPKLCMECGLEMAMADGDPQIVTRKSGTDELRAYLKKKEQH